MIHSKNLTLIILVLLIFNIGCKEESTPTIFEYEADPIGEWYLGDFHVHATGASNDTGGDSFPEVIKSKAISIGLDFVVLTDHSNSTGSDASTTYEDPTLFNMGPEFPFWEEAANLTEEGTFLMIDGNELSPVQEESLGEARGHIGCIPRELDGFDTDSPFIDRPKGAVTGGNALQQALERGCYTIINHPYGLLPWIKYDWTNLNYDAIEVWNGTIGYDGADESARRIWICDLLNGKATTLVGGSDCHRVNTEAPGVGTDPALGYPTTAVYATELTWPAIIQGLDNGQTAVFGGNSRLYIDGYNTDGKRIENTETKIIRLRGIADSNLVNPVVKLFHTTDCNDPRPSTDIPTITEISIFEQSILADSNFDIRVDIEGKTGVYTAMIGEGDINYLALSRAIVIN